MVKHAHILGWLLALACLAVLLAGCNSLFPVTPVPSTAMGSIDHVLQDAVTGSLAYNAPASMQLDNSVEIQLLVSPFASPEDLKKMIVDSGNVSASDLTVTPLMKAELISDDPAAFVIQALHDSPEQVVLVDQPSEWRWTVTAKKSGDRVVTLTVMRQIQYNGVTSWRLVQAYKNKIHITVSASQELKNFDWKWLVGILLTALLIPAIWRIVDARKKKAAGDTK